MPVSSVPVQLPSVPVTVHSKYRSEYEILTSVVQFKSQMSDVWCQKTKDKRQQSTVKSQMSNSNVSVKSVDLVRS